MQLHQRSNMVARTKGDIELAILKIVDEKDLTFGEIVSVLGGIIQNFAMYQIREERHGDASKKGDEA